MFKKAYPEHAIIAEESGTTGESDTVWVIDPLDGTTNFLHGFPQFAVSMALEMAMQDVLGNMEELALDFGFSDGAGCFEILAIEPAEVADAAQVSHSTRLRSPYSAELVYLTDDKQVRVA